MTEGRLYDWVVAFERIGCPPFRVTVEARHYIEAGTKARDRALEHECGDSLISIQRIGAA